MKTFRLIRLVAASRVAWGAALAFKTAPLLRLMVRDTDPTGSLLLFARTVGIRDLVFGLAALIDSYDEPELIDRWLLVWLASDIADVFVGMTASRHVGRGGAFAAASAPVPFVAAGLWALRSRSSDRRSA